MKCSARFSDGIVKYAIPWRPGAARETARGPAPEESAEVRPEIQECRANRLVWSMTEAV